MSSRLWSSHHLRGTPPRIDLIHVKSFPRCLEPKKHEMDKTHALCASVSSSAMGLTIILPL